MTRRRAFTLLELLTTLVIISILATLATPRVRDAIYRAKATELLERVRTIQAALTGVDISVGVINQQLGTLPGPLSAVLNADTFLTPDGIKLGIAEKIDPTTGTKRPEIIMLGSSQQARRVAYLWHTMETDEHLFNGVISRVWLTRTPCTRTVANGCRMTR